MLNGLSLKLHISQLGVLGLGNTPKMLWTDCPLIHDCEKCLEVEFEFEKDIACLDNKWADNSCVFEGKLVEGGSRVFVSSEQCLINGDLSIIQVSIVKSYLEI